MHQQQFLHAQHSPTLLYVYLSACLSAWLSACLPVCCGAACLSSQLIFDTHHWGMTGQLRASLRRDMGFVEDASTFGIVEGIDLHDSLTGMPRFGSKICC